ncbi:MAG: hypothetical protein ACRCSF_05550 [Mycobacteriaceae bacterium]
MDDEDLRRINAGETESQAQMNAIVQSVEERARLLQQAADDVTSLRGWARSPQGEVETEVNSNGALTNLWLHENTMKMSAKDLSELITVTAAHAAQAAQEQRLKIMLGLEEAMS